MITKELFEEHDHQTTVWLIPEKLQHVEVDTQLTFGV
jgi:hypothetical protein